MLSQRFPWILLGVVLVLVGCRDSTAAKTCAGCPSAATRGTKCSPVSGAVAQGLVGKGAQLVDVRTPMEFSMGHIDGAVNVPLDDLEKRIAELDHERPVVVYCRSGNRSGKATRKLCDAGFSVYDLGPKTAWPN